MFIDKPFAKAHNICVMKDKILFIMKNEALHQIFIFKY